MLRSGFPTRILSPQPRFASVPAPYALGRAAGTDELTPESQEHPAPALRRSPESLHPERGVQGRILGFGQG